MVVIFFIGRETMETKLSHKAQTRQRILTEAARVMREYGTEGIGVAALMKRAGLTHGGFYAHFTSREALVEAVVEQMFADSAQRFAAILQTEDPRQSLMQFIDHYLSEHHCMNVSEGCPLPILSGEMAHLPLATRQVFSQKRAVLCSRLAEVLKQMNYPDAEEQALSMLSEMVGALSLARACAEPEEASQMLKVSRRSLKKRLEIA